MLPGFQRSDQLAVLCAQLPELRRLHRGPVGAQARVVLERAVAAARCGEPIEAYAEQLRITPSAGPVTSDDGVPRTSLPPRMGGEPAYLSGVYVCPRDACARAEYREVGSGLPACAVYDLALRFVEER